MEKRLCRALLGVLTLAVLGICCKTTDPAEEVFIPSISNTWTDIADTRHTFSFTTNDVGVSKGSFNGFENHSDSVLSFPLNGTFSNRLVAFTVSRRGRDTTYSGRFTADTLIDCGALKIYKPR